jgi:hypothetical protein
MSQKKKVKDVKVFVFNASANGSVLVHEYFTGQTVKKILCSKDFRNSLQKQSGMLLEFDVFGTEIPSTKEHTKDYDALVSILFKIRDCAHV